MTSDWKSQDQKRKITITIIKIISLINTKLTLKIILSACQKTKYKLSVYLATSWRADELH